MATRYTLEAHNAGELYADLIAETGDGNLARLKHVLEKYYMNLTNQALNPVVTPPERQARLCVPVRAFVT